MNEKELKTIDEIALEFLNGCKKALELERKIMNLQETEETDKEIANGYLFSSEFD